MHWSRQTFGAGQGTIKSGKAGGGGVIGMHWSPHTIQQSRAERRGGGGGFGMHWSLQAFPQPRGGGRQ